MDENVLTPNMDNQLLEEYEVIRMAGRLNMRYWDDSVLSTVCKPIEKDEFGGNLAEFTALLTTTMEKSGTGVGLAASQVGLTKRLFVMKLDTSTIALPATTLVVCNPVLSKFKGREVGQEGCLSFPTLYDQVERALSVRMDYQTVDGESAVLSLTGFEARVAQHEVDHLDGIMFFQRMSKQMRKHLLREWEKIRGKYEG
jgi:peptide deformylase